MPDPASSSSETGTSSSSRWDLYCSEPYRIFFPLGLLASCAGVLLWPFNHAGWLTIYPLEAHSRWMIPAFAGCMITGFLGTAGPRLIGSAPWSRFELLLHTFMALVVMTCLAFFEVNKADIMTAFWLLGVVASLVLRLLLDRNDVPPPGLPLVLLGLTGTTISSFALGISTLVPIDYDWAQFWRLLYFQGTLWLPITGVAPYLLPRFFGRASLHSFDDSLKIPPGWTRQFLGASLAGLLLILSFALEAFFNPSHGQILRALVVTTYLGFFVPGLLAFDKVNALAWSVRWILPSAALTWLLIPVWPHFRIGISHLMFIGAAGSLMLAVATRVILGHQNRHDRLASSLRWYHLVWGGLLLTASTRLSADFVPKVRLSHLTYAALLWVILIGFWAFRVRKELRTPLPEGSGAPIRCPKRQRSNRSRQDS